MHVMICFSVLFSVTSKLMQSICDPLMNCCAGIFKLKWNIYIFLHVVIAETILYHLMCIHVREWIFNLLSFICLIFADGFFVPQEQFV